ncbi:hypothetical protein [Rhodopila sp.]|jgi:hypothetical protein|uniref:hypothetical protein n=1 Tax=Rhodopila sp. TaxID=2480087 RepID=UPI002B71260B|nr:hypothetical protein [Rhodopila sp.]HVZ07076.1 hypothetical protein [Rhodopila sp.]
MSDDNNRMLQILLRLDENMRAQNDQIFMLAEDMRGQRAELRSQGEQLRLQGEELRSHRETLNVLIEQVGILGTGLQSNRQEIHALSERMLIMRTELMSRMDRLQDSITMIRDDVTVNDKTADRALDMNEHTRAEVRSLGEVVTAMSYQIQRLQADVRALKGDP